MYIQLGRKIALNNVVNSINVSLCIKVFCTWGGDYYGFGPFLNSEVKQFSDWVRTRGLLGRAGD